MKKPKSFKLSDQSIDALSLLVSVTGITETAIVEYAIANEALRMGYVVNRGASWQDIMDAAELRDHKQRIESLEAQQNAQG